MIIVTTPYLAGHRVVEAKGQVFGLVVLAGELVGDVEDLTPVLADDLRPGILLPREAALDQRRPRAGRRRPLVVAALPGQVSSERLLGGRAAAGQLEESEIAAWLRPRLAPPS